MANFAIKGHKTRGKEVIEILKMLGGVNKYKVTFTETNLIYCLREDDSVIIATYPNNHIKDIFTLEEFLDKFPYKVGDKVQHKGATSCGTVYEILQMKWEDNQIKYIVCDLYWRNCKNIVTTKDIQPFKEETMEERKYSELRMPLDDDDKLATEATIDGDKITPPNNYLIGKITKVDNGMLVEFVKKQFQYPKTYEECCKVLFPNSIELGKVLTSGYNCELLKKLGELLICRDAYWKIAGEEMGLGKPWEPDWSNAAQRKYCIVNTEGNVLKWVQKTTNKILAFPTAEMCDAFYENFKDLIEQCKELL